MSTTLETSVSKQDAVGSSPMATASAAPAAAITALPAPAPELLVRRRTGLASWVERLLDHRDDKIALLREVPALAHCTRDELIALARTADLVTLGPGASIDSSGLAGPWWAVVIQGSLVSGPTGTMAGPRGAKLLIAARARVNDLFGTTPGLRSAVARSEENTYVPVPPA